jgi:hypothetical protein
MAGHGGNFPHHSRVVRHAYSKHAEVSVPSLENWETEWEHRGQRTDGGNVAEVKLLAVDFGSAQIVPCVSETEPAMVSLAQSN